MEQVNNIELANPLIYPDNIQLKEVLKESYNTYCDLIKLYEAYELTPEWKYYKDGKAWLCKVQKGKRTIVWMSAWKGFMKATIYFPEKYIKGIYDLDISESEKEIIRKSNNVGKSKPCTYEIRNPSILKTFEKIMIYKIISK